MPMGPRLAELASRRSTGSLLDTFGVQAGRSYRDEVLDPPPGVGPAPALFQTMQARAMPKVPDRALAAPVRRGRMRSTRRQFRREVERFDGSGSPSAPVGLRDPRRVRAIALLPMQGMGR